MSGITLIVDRRETSIRLEGKALRIDRPDVGPERIPLAMLERMVVTGSPLVACDVWRAMAELNIPAILLPGRGAGPAAMLGAGLGSGVELRIAQYRAAADPETSLMICRWLLGAKLTGQQSLVKQLVGSMPDHVWEETFHNSWRGIRMASSRASLMGVEGAAAAASFKLLAKILPREWGFSGRNRRPPRDPFNALLSLGYVLAGGEILKVVQGKGLDPGLGFLHASQHGRAALVLDLLEPHRPVIDNFVLSLTKGLLTPNDFTISSQEGCRLSKEARGIFYRTWFQYLNTGHEEGIAEQIKKTVTELCQHLSKKNENL